MPLLTEAQCGEEAPIDRGDKGGRGTAIETLCVVWVRGHELLKD